jgi:hypothetical protein
LLLLLLLEVVVFRLLALLVLLLLASSAAGFVRAPGTQALGAFRGCRRFCSWGCACAAARATVGGRAAQRRYC